MTEEMTEEVATGECGACRAVIPLDSEQCPECGVSFTGVSDEALGECGACQALVPLDSTKCPQCGVVFIADDVVDVLRNWLVTTGITIPMLFKKFDTDGDGQIDSSELKSGLLSLNLADLPPSQVDRLIETIDADGDGRLDLHELHATITGEDLPDTAAEDSDKEQVDAETSSGDVEKSVEDEMEEDSEEESEAGEDETTDDDESLTDVSEDDIEAEEGEESPDQDESEDRSEEASNDEDSSSNVVEDKAEDTKEPLDIEEKDESEEEVEEDEEVQESLIRRLADAMDELEISPNRFFNDLDKDGSGSVDVLELVNALGELIEEDVSADDIEEFLNDVDDDGDRTIDMIEFIAALEELEDADEVVDEKATISKSKEVKPFPTDMQKKMMGKQWNDVVWPLIHLAFGMFVALIVLNAFGGIGPISVDGTGGPVALDMSETLIHPDGIVNGDIYDCDPQYQIGDCKNSLTPLAGDSSSMPAGWYWDGILFALLGTCGLVASLYGHLILMKSWRARAKAMKEVQDDKSDAEDVATESEEESSEDSDDLEEEMQEALEEDYEDEELGDDEEDDSSEEEETEPEGEADDEIDIGSHIGLTLEDEEVFGTIIEFDDDDETVTIEEDETGDIITGYQEDMFVE